MDYYSLAEEIKQHEVEEKAMKQDEFYYNADRYCAEINAMTNIAPVLRSFIRYSSKGVSNEEIAILTVRKLQDLTE